MVTMAREVEKLRAELSNSDGRAWAAGMLLQVHSFYFRHTLSETIDARALGISDTEMAESSH